jgi:hypothetical protein
MIIDNKKQHPTSTTLQSRTAMFLPVKALSKNYKEINIKIKNQYGTLVLSDIKLTQTHRNIVDCIFSYYEPIYLDDGSAAFVFSKYDLLKKLGHSSRKNGKWLESKFEEMRMASLRLLTEDSAVKEIDYQGVISRHKSTKIKEKNENKYGVLFSPNFMSLFDKDLNIYSQALTHEIISLGHAVVQAFVREVISHVQVNRPLDEILDEIGVKASMEESLENREGNEVSQRAYRKKKKEIMDLKETLLEKFGIELKTIASGDNVGKMGVFYKKHKGVYFKNPEPIIEADEE